MASEISKFLNKVKKETGAVSFKESKYGTVSNWISTGSYALNRIISGSIYKGFPSGRVILLGGESATGKSLIAAMATTQAINDGYDAVFYFDSEGGSLNEFFENIGCDTTKVMQILINSVEDAQIQISKTMSLITSYKEENPDAKFLCVLDSLGALITEKLLRDSEKDKVASDMGGRAKLCNNLVKSITVPALRTDTAFIILNHIYQDPASLFSNKILNQGGGLGAQYMGSINIQCTRNLAKDTDTKSETFHSGTNLTFFTVKNRMCRPSLTAKIYLDFKKGFSNKYDGLFEEAIRGGFIVNCSSGWYNVPSCDNPEKKWREAELINNETIWSKFIDEFEKWSINDLKYSKREEIEMEEAEEEVEEILETVEYDEETMELIRDINS